MWPWWAWLGDIREGFLFTELRSLRDSWDLESPGFALDKALGGGMPSVFSGTNGIAVVEAASPAVGDT